MSTQSWRGTPDHEPQITSSVRRWFRARAANILQTYRAVGKLDPLDPDELSRRVDVLESGIEQYVHWTAHQFYGGRGYAMGAWKVDEAKVVVAGVSNGTLRAVRSELDDRRPVVGRPLPEPDIEAALAELAQEPEEAPPHETVAFLILERAQSARLYAAVGRIRKRFPQPCSCCGQMFTGLRSRATKGPNDGCPRRAPEDGPTCPDCRTAGNRRCRECHQVFSVASQKQRRCECCLQKPAEAP
jgi:hypothetical protein